jgi:hypothetical protein
LTSFYRFDPDGILFLMLSRAGCRVCIFLLVSSILFPPFPHRAKAQSSEGADNQPVQVAMRNVTYHFTDHIAVHIVQLLGSLTPTKPDALVVLDNSSSYTLNLAAAEIALGCNSLAQVLNENLFSASKAPIKQLTIEARNNQLVIKGKLHRKGDVPFETTGTLLVEGDGRVRLHTEHLKAAHLPVKGLMDLLGIDVARMINTKKVPGVSADKDDLILNPEQIFPPPQIRGRITAIWIQGNEIVQVFGTLSSNSVPKEPGNYMEYRHGDLGFGKLTMKDADLILIDMDPRDPFDFYLDHYKEQLVAGYAKTTPELGLRVYARDYNKLHRQPASGSPSK